MAWLFDEDEALKQKLSNNNVYDYGHGANPTPISVYYRFPSPEERTRTFPYISIDMISIEFDATRAHRAVGHILPYDTETATPLDGFVLSGDDMPLPWSLVYQLSCFSRQPWEDRQLAALMYQSFPEQFGYLDMTYFDGTTRRADLMTTPFRRDRVDGNNKRIYCNIFTVAISSQFYVYEIQAIQKVSTVAIDFGYVVNQPVVIP